MGSLVPVTVHIRSGEARAIAHGFRASSWNCSGGARSLRFFSVGIDARGDLGRSWEGRIEGSLSRSWSSFSRGCCLDERFLREDGEMVCEFVDVGANNR